MTNLYRTADSLAEVLTGISAAKKVLIIVQIYNYYVSGHFPSPCPEIGSSPVDWTQLSSLHLKKEIEYCLPKLLF
jgi:hypothetical protein